MAEEQDYIQRPVDEAYRLGIEGMPHGRPSASDWFNQVAQMLAFGLAMRGGVGNFKPGVPRPRSPQHEATLQDIKLAMSRLLRGNAPPKEPDPRIVRQVRESRQGAIDADVLDRHVYWGVGEPAGVPRVSTGAPLHLHLPMISMKSDIWPKGGVPGVFEAGRRRAAFFDMVDDLRRRDLFP